ncbi:hypothetical protein [Nocardia callitridis]|uniref:DUF222 domain-containing protein n=1 Tax=Nocardia callitridis TaxID=648753 RepID=A0ABP9JUX1_9NOCA
MPSCDDIAAAWLSGTDFAGDRDAVDLLSRAISPQEFAINRESLPVTAAADPTTAEAILELLRRHQVPTIAAIRTLTAQNDMRREAERIERLGRRAQRSIDDFGRVLATLADAHWRAHGTGPTRRDVLSSEQIMHLVQAKLGNIAPSAVKHLWLIERAQRAGWIASNADPGSLCAGRRFHASQYGNRVSLRPVNTIGTAIAAYIDDRIAENGVAPRWSTLTQELRDDRGRRIFHNTADARAQELWLSTAGWIEVRDGLLYPGRRGLRAIARQSRTRERDTVGSH